MRIEHVEMGFRTGEERSLIVFSLTYNFISVNSIDEEYRCMETQLTELDWYRNIEFIDESHLRIWSNIESLSDQEEIVIARTNIITIINECYGRNFEDL